MLLALGQLYCEPLNGHSGGRACFKEIPDQKQEFLPENAKINVAFFLLLSLSYCLITETLTIVVLAIIQDRYS